MTTPPPDYIPPVLVYLVEEPDEVGYMQVGGFFTEEEAEKLLRRLTAEGRQARINMVPIHQRALDYEYDR